MKPELFTIINKCVDFLLASAGAWIAHSIAKVVSNVSMIPKIREDLNLFYKRVRVIETKIGIVPEEK